MCIWRVIFSFWTYVLYKKVHLNWVNGVKRHDLLLLWLYEYFCCHRLSQSMRFCVSVFVFCLVFYFFMFVLWQHRLRLNFMQIHSISIDFLLWFWSQTDRWFLLWKIDSSNNNVNSSGGGGGDGGSNNCCTFSVKLFFCIWWSTFKCCMCVSLSACVSVTTNEFNLFTNSI